MQPSMRLADEPNSGAIWHNYFLPRPLKQCFLAPFYEFIKQGQHTIKGGR
jgi:hypothetical protein